MSVTAFRPHPSCTSLELLQFCNETAQNCEPWLRLATIKTMLACFQCCWREQQAGHVKEREGKEGKELEGRGERADVYLVCVQV